MAEAKRTFGKGELIAAVVIALAVGFYAGTVFMELRAPSVSAGQSTAAGMPPAGPGAGQGAGKDDGHDHTAELAHIRDLEAVTAANPKDQAKWVELANLYFDTHQAKKAIVAYETALGLGKASPDVWTDLGIMQREDGQPKKALDSFDAALSINPSHENALYNKGVVQLHDTGDKAGAAATWAKLLGINPGAKTPDGRPLKSIVDDLARG